MILLSIACSNPRSWRAHPVARCRTSFLRCFLSSMRLWKLFHGSNPSFECHDHVLWMPWSCAAGSDIASSCMHVKHFAGLSSALPSVPKQGERSWRWTWSACHFLTPTIPTEKTKFCFSHFLLELLRTTSSFCFSSIVWLLYSIFYRACLWQNWRACYKQIYVVTWWYMHHAWSVKNMSLCQVSPVWQWTCICLVLCGCPAGSHSLAKELQQSSALVLASTYSLCGLSHGATNLE